VHLHYRLCRLSDMPELLGLSTGLYPMTFAAFVAGIKTCPKHFPVTSFQILRDVARDSLVMQNTLGFCAHRYIVAGVLLPDGRTLYIRADYYITPIPRTSSRLGVILAYDYETITRDSELIAHLAISQFAVTTTYGGPTLDALAFLLDVADARVAASPFGVVGRNCYWLADVLFCCMARGFDVHWLAGCQIPATPLRRYLLGDAGALEMSIACTMPPNKILRRAIWWGETALRGLQVLVTLYSPNRSLMHDDEVADWIRAWEAAIVGRSKQPTGFGA
ncbi:hypothetical protein C8Q78DRAFT_972920, partial [Trametes maxima]